MTNRNGKPKTVTIRGVVYSSYSEASRSLGYNPGALSVWVCNGKSLETFGLKKGKAHYTVNGTKVYGLSEVFKMVNIGPFDEVRYKIRDKLTRLGKVHYNGFKIVRTRKIRE